MEAAIAYDATKFIEASIKEVQTTLIEAGLIVIVVIFLFLGNLRSTIIPVVTIPLSLIGVMFVLLALGYSINLLTLLALVLAIGLVVDDAIVVVENIHRHIEEGMQPYDAAITGAREIAVPVISMTITLAAVYAPIGFVAGLTGALFREFAFTLAGAVVVSGIIALTLSPMMASKLLKAEHGSGRFVRILDRVFGSLRRRYEGRLHRTLDRRPVTIMVLVGVMAATAIMYMTSQKRAGARGRPGHPVQRREDAAARQPRLSGAGDGATRQGVRNRAREGARLHHQRPHRRAPGVLGHPVQAVGGAHAHAKADPGGACRARSPALPMRRCSRSRCRRCRVRGVAPRCSS